MGSPATADEVRGIADVAQRLVRSTYQRFAWLRRAVLVSLCVLAAVCVTAVVTRSSPLPLAPLPLLGVAGYALRRTRTAPDDRALLTWTAVLLAAGAVGFWLLGMMARLLG